MKRNAKRQEVTRDIVIKAITETLGPPGRMISGSKTRYCHTHPKDFVLFNANLIITHKKQPVKIWYGDLNITLDANQLISIAKQSNSTFYVLYEMDARFENEMKPKMQSAAAIITPDGITIGKKYLPYFDENLKCVSERKAINFCPMSY